jgi:hypothetical protein
MYIIQDFKKIIVLGLVLLASQIEEFILPHPVCSRSTHLDAVVLS